MERLATALDWGFRAEVCYPRRPVSTTLAALGRGLFRWRSYTPLTVIAFAALWLALGPGAPMPGPRAALFAAGIGCALLGQAIRFYLMGTVRDGTSGQDYELCAVALNTHGPYRFTRNPLYLGNFLISLGVVLFVGDWVVLGAWLIFFFSQYTAIIRAEEEYLRGQFGALYDEYTARVPRFWPRLTPAAPPEGGARAAPFDLGRAVKKEHNPAFAWLSAALWLWALPDLARREGGALALDSRAVSPYLGAWLVMALGYTLIKLWKKGKL